MTPKTVQCNQTPGTSLAKIRMRDPFILESSLGKFVLYGTTDENPWGGHAVGFDCYTSDDLLTWSGPVPAFRPPAGFWSDTQFWAPEVYHYDDRFYMLASFGDSTGTHARGVAVLVADDPTGPFEPWSEGPVTPSAYPCLDGTLHLDADGHPWLVYGRGAEGSPDGAAGIADGEMYALRLSSDLKAAAGEPHLLFTASSASWSQPMSFPEGIQPPQGLNLPNDPRFTDGPFIVQSPGTPLRMLWSSHGRDGYTLGVATSTSGLITGPWEQHDEVLWAGNGGHGMILTTSGRNYLVFHTPNDTPHERVTLIEVDITPQGISFSSGTGTNR